MMNNTPSKKATNNQSAKQHARLIKYILCFWCFIFAIFYATQGKAEETMMRSTTVGAYKTEKNSPLALTSVQPSVISKKIYRSEHLKAKLAAFNKKQVSKRRSPIARSVAHEFVVYDGYSKLLTDLDQDGYFHRFSIFFDADVITYSGSNQAQVYAEIYLSENGGSWFHFHTTDNFIITGESTDDEFEITSSLDAGYNPNNYDVLIDLYEVGYQDIVASYSSDNSNDLYALPLESYDYDVVIEEEHIHGGSLSAYSMLLIAFLFMCRLLNSLKSNKS